MITTIAWELRQRRFAIFWWTLGSILISGFILLLYPPIRNQAHQFNQLINQLPPGLRELKSGGASSIVATARLIGQTTGAALAALCFSLADREGATLALALGAGFAALGSVMSFLRLAVTR